MKISKYILLLVILFSSTLSFSVSPAPERVFVHTDRNIYVAGEDILYSFYLINDESRDSSKISTIGYLELISSNDVAVTQTRLSINKSYGHGILSIPDSLTTGVYMLRGYIRSMRNYGPDIFFTRYLTIYNPFKETIKYSQQDTVGIIDDDVYINREVNLKNIAGLKSDFGTREKVTMKLQLDSSSFSNPDMCNISVAVAVSRDNTDSDNITDFITAKNIPAGTVSGDHSNNVMRETIGPYLEGSVISRASLQPVKDKRLYLSVPGKNTYLRYSDTDENGNFIFLFPPYKGKRDFIIQSADFSDDLIIKTLSPFANMHDVDQEISIVIGKELLDYASRLGVNYQVNRIYDTGNRVTEVVNNNDTLIYRFYGRPDLQVFLDDYIDLPTMQEVFHELVPGVVLRREGEGATLLFTNEPGAERLSGPEAVFLDGVIIDDPSFIAGLDPDLIERIDVIKGQYQISSMIINGIISISSFEGDMCGFDYPGAGLITSSTILEKEHKYNNFTYSDRLPQDSHIPDFRNTLYWNPELKPDDEGLIEFTFYTSDFLSEYVITIQGLTGNYVPLYYTGTIKVTR